MKGLFDIGTGINSGVVMSTSLAAAESVLHRVRDHLSEGEREDENTAIFLNVGTAARYLRGYHDEAKAARNMLATYHYRRLVHAEDLGKSASTFRTVWTELSKRSMFLASLSDGAEPPSPVLILRKKGEAFDREDFEDYRRAFFFTLDCTAKFADKGLGSTAATYEQKGQWVIVMDMLGYSSKNSPPLGVSMETLRIFQHHFPERAKRIIVLDAPRTFNFLWRMLSPFIDPVTREKFLFTSRSGGEETLRQQVGSNVMDCINMDLEKGKRESAKLMVDAGFLLPEGG